MSGHLLGSKERINITVASALKESTVLNTVSQTFGLQGPFNRYRQCTQFVNSRPVFKSLKLNSFTILQLIVFSQ